VNKKTLSEDDKVLSATTFVMVIYKHWIIFIENIPLCIKLRENKIVSGFSQHNVIFFFTLMTMFCSIDHHQAMLCKGGLIMVT
jgi:hypothetical protein